MPAYFETGFFMRQPAWHGLGIVRETEPQTAQEALVAAGLDWEVILAEPFFKMPGMRRSFAAPDRRLVVRATDHAVLGNVSAHYKPLQNRDGFAWVQALVDTGYWKWETGGSLKNGAVCWALLKQSKAQIIPGDIVEEYLFISWAHDGSRSLLACPTMIRVVCWNTLSSAVWGAAGHKKLVSIRHTGDMKAKLEEAKRLFDHTQEMFDEQKKQLAKLADVKMTDAKLEKFVDGLFPVDKDSSTCAKRNNEFVKQMVVDGNASGAEKLEVKNTLYGAVMAVGEAAEYYLGGRRIRDRGVSVMSGTAADIQRSALQSALQLAKLN